MIHTSDVKPKVYPHNGTGTVSEIDRLQDMSASVSLNRTKINEIGRDGAVAWKAGTPSISLTLRQFEYGNMEFFRQLANKPSSVTKIDLEDYKSAWADIAAYKTEENTGQFLATVWYPKLRTSGFSLNIGDPEASLERNFTLVGEDEFTLQGNNKYLIYGEVTCAAPGAETIVIGAGAFANYPDPVLDPDESAVYILRLTKVVAGIETELVLGTGYTYTPGTTTIVVLSVLATDIIRFWYSATTYIVGTDPFTLNDADAAELSADCCSIYLQTTNYVYRLQSVTLDVTYERTDYKEIGNKEIVLRGARTITATITLGRFLETYSVEEILRGVAPGYGIIDIREFPTTGAKLVIKVYDNNDKTTFKMGYAITDCNVTGLEKGIPVDDYVTQNVTLEGSAGHIVSLESDL